MAGIRPPTLAERAAVHAALGDPHRLAIVDALALSDRSPSELARLLDIESNLLAHHLDALERVHVVERLISSGDRRRRYLRLKPETLEHLDAGRAVPAHTVLFVCTHNSARSQMAAALWNRHSEAHAESAGTHPAERIHPRAVATAARHGLDIAHIRPRTLDEVEAAPDLIVTVCDRAHEELPGHDGIPALHWSIDDPIEAGTPAAFEQAFQALRHRVVALAPLVAIAS